jgi:hypothetical protein
VRASLKHFKRKPEISGNLRAQARRRQAGVENSFKQQGAPA